MPRPHASAGAKPANPGQTAIGWLDADQHGASVLTTARMLLAIEQAARQILPPGLAQVCRVARMERQQITLAVPSAAYAARLRQLAPRVAAQLASSGWNLNEIHVKVQAGLLQSQTKTASPRQAIPLDHDALDAFEELQRKLRPGSLADAVSRLLRRHRAG